VRGKNILVEESENWMNFLKLHVMLKMLKRGVQPDKDMLDEAIVFIDSYARKELRTRY
jgi:hypothetical protein